MDNIIKINTEGLRAEIAHEIGVSPQGFANRLNAYPLLFLEKLTASLCKRNEFKARNIYADICARFGAIFEKSKVKFSLVEVVRVWQMIFVNELEFPGVNRWELLQVWRELVVFGNVRICELTEVLESKKRFGY
jgi:hypothetical protein